MNDMRRVWFPAFRKVFPEDFENWMEEMAALGWNVDRVGQWNSLLMTFKRSGPKKYRFVYDIQPTPRKDYMDTYRQFGWEFVGQMASVYLWRKEYADERPEAFSDRESIKSRNRRTALAASVSFFIFLLWDLIMAVILIFFPNCVSAGDRTQFFWAELFSLAVTLLIGLAMFNIVKKSKRLF